MDEIERKLEIALEKDSYHDLMKSWVYWEFHRKSLKSNRLQELKTWPLSLPNVGKISLATIISFLSIFIKLLIEFFYP